MIRAAIRRSATRAGTVTALALALSSCASGPPGLRRSAGGTIPTGRPVTALVPLENLAGREDQGALFTKVIFGQLVASGALEMVEPGRVDEAMDHLGIRSGGGMTPAQVRAMGDTLNAPYLLMGSVLESGKVQSNGVELPAVGATLRLVRTADGRVMWAGVHFRSGEDRETVFGWGRVSNDEKLVWELVSDLLRDFRDAGARNPRGPATEASR